MLEIKLKYVIILITMSKMIIKLMRCQVKRYCTLVLILCLLLLLGGCKEKEKEFVPGDKELIHLTSTPKGGVETYQIYTTNIKIFVDGTVIIYASDFVRWLGDGDIPQTVFTITPDEVEQIKQIIVDGNLYNLREDVGNKDGIDGVIKKMTIYAESGTHTTGGISVSNRQFVRAYDAIENIVREELFIYTGEINATQLKGHEKFVNRSVEILDREGGPLLDHTYINDVYTFVEELDDGNNYYTVIEFNTYGLDILKELTAWASDEETITVSIHVNGSFEKTVAITAPISDGKMYIQQNDEISADALVEKIKSGM